MKNYLLVFFIATIFSSYSQKINKSSFSINYIKKPLTPLSKDITSIDAKSTMLYTKEIDEKLKDAQDEYQRKLDAYPQKVKDAKERYDVRMTRYEKNMEEWKKTSLGTKFIEKQILKEDNKPRKPGPFYPPAEPTLRKVSHQKLFDEENLSRSYLIITGFNQGTEKALKIAVELFGFDSNESDPVTKTSKKYNSSTKSYTSVTTTTYPVSYKHPITLKVETPSGEILHEGTFENTDEWIQTSSTRYPNETFYRNLESSVVKNTMSRIKSYLNNNYGFTNVKKTILLYTPSSKKMDYSDFQDAYYDANEGFQLLIENNKEAIEKINKAIVVWEKAIEESDVNDRKARVNAKVTKFTYQNLYQSYIFTNSFEKAKDVLKRAYGTSPSKKDMKSIASSRKFINDLEKRFKANN